MIDILLTMKGKLTKEGKRHLDDARRDKQVKQHAVRQAHKLPPVRSSFRPRKPSLAQCLPPLRLFCSPPCDIVFTLESQTKSDLLDRARLPCALLVSAAYHLLHVRATRAVSFKPSSHEEESSSLVLFSSTRVLEPSFY